MTSHPDDVAAVGAAIRDTATENHARLAENAITALDAARAKRLPEKVAKMYRWLKDGKEGFDPYHDDNMGITADLLLSLSAQVEAANARAKTAEIALKFCEDAFTEWS